MNEFHYFQTPIYREEKPEWVNQTLTVLEKHYQETKNRKLEVNDHSPVTQTQHIGQDAELTFLANYFGSTAVQLLEQQGYQLDQYDFYVSGMWGQEFEKFGINDLHVHPNTQMCGVYFLNTPHGGSYPIFSDPRPGKSMNEFFMIDYENVYLGTPKIHFNNVLPGTFLFFNAWVPHQITANFSDEPTRFIHFLLSVKQREQ